MRLRLVALLAGFTSIGLACGHDYSSTQEAPIDAGVDASVEAGPVADAGADAEADADGGGCPVLYVSAGGSDLNTGCDQTKPKATITGAIGYVKTLALTNEEIHVCAGTYTENGLTLDYPVTLRGGYECSLWERHTPFAWGGLSTTTGHANFDLTNETILEAGTATVALTVSGGAVTSATSIEGFTIQGNATAGGMGLVLEDGTAALIVNDRILGPAAGPSSRGLQIKDTTTSEVMHCIIGGGNAGTPAGAVAGSIGVVINTTGNGPTIHDNEIDSGDGVSGAASTVGVQVVGATTLTGPQAFRDNTVFFRGSIATAGIASYGIVVAATAQGDFVGNGLYGGAINCTTTTCVAYGIYVQGSNTNVVSNRIYAGSIAASAQPPQLYPLFVDGSPSDVLIANNVVLFEAGALSDGIGIAASHTTTNVQIEHNTIVIPLGQSIATGIFTTGQNAHVDDNLIVGARTGYASAQSPCIDVTNHTDYPPVSLANNAFVGVQLLGSLVAGSNCEGSMQANTIGDLATLLPVTANDIMLSSACTTGDTTCYACTTAACLEVFADTPSFATLVQGDARLAAAVTCAIAKGGDSNLTLAPTDLAGAVRRNQTTIGALEDDGACTGP